MRFKATREFYIPKDAQIHEYPELAAVAYLHSHGENPAAVCFSSKRQKPDLNFYYRSEERREKAIQEWLDGLKRSQEYKAQRKAERTGLMEPAHSAKVLKSYLQQFFPGVKFSVSSRTFSMGDSIDVDYTDGPPREEVEAISNVFQNSGFDGMQDLSYSVSVHVPGCSGSKYIHVNRHHSDVLKAAILPVLQERFAHRYGDGDKVGDYAPYQLAEAERHYLCVTEEEIARRNQERIAIITGIRVQDTPEAQEGSPAQGNAESQDAPSNLIAVDFSKATRRQMQSLQRITRLDTSNWPLSRVDADYLITAANNGVDIIAEFKKNLETRN